MIYKSYPPEMAAAWPNFVEEEVACRCGCGALPDPEIMDVLQSIRNTIGRPLQVSSGARCQKHDKAVGGRGNHTTGFAVDILADSRLKYLIVREALGEGVTRIGVGKDFVHLDLVTPKPQYVLWTYGD